MMERNNEFSLKKSGAVCYWLLSMLLTIGPIVVSNVSFWLINKKRPINQLFDEMVVVLLTVAGSLAFICFQVIKKKGIFLACLKVAPIVIAIVAWTILCLIDGGLVIESEGLIEILLIVFVVFIVMFSILGGIICGVGSYKENKTIQDMHKNCKEIMEKNYSDEEKKRLISAAQCEYALLCHPECYERAKENLYNFRCGQKKQGEYRE